MGGGGGAPPGGGGVATGPITNPPQPGSIAEALYDYQGDPQVSFLFIRPVDCLILKCCNFILIVVRSHIHERRQDHHLESRRR